MKGCIYCGNTDEFNDEHVIPQFLGEFKVILKKKFGLVCKKCNSVTFSALETIMKEDSLEGLYSQQLNLVGSGSVRIQGRRLKMDSVTGFGDRFFDEMFPFLKVQQKDFVIEIKSQVKVKNYADGYQIFPVETLRKLKAGSNFKKIKERLSKVKNSDISIFLGVDSSEDNELDEIILLLKDYGVDYSEKNRIFEPTKKIQNTKWEVNVQCTVDRDIGRLLAKIVFNYLTYCASIQGQVVILYGDEFKKIRDFIKGDEYMLLKDIVSMNKEPILQIERDENQRMVCHMIVFEIKREKIIGRLTIFGRNVYEIVIGDVPTVWQEKNFGCGHAFDPFKRKIFNLFTKQIEAPSSKDLITTFGLFQKESL